MNANHLTLARRTLLFAMLVPATARAVNWNMEGHDHGNRHGAEGTDRDRPYEEPITSIGPHDTGAIQSYYRSLAAGGHCPPGLIPGAAGCVPPGPVGRWAVGQPLPREAAAEPLPSDLNARLSPLYGYHYVRVGGDVLLLADGTGVVQAVMPIL